MTDQMLLKIQQDVQYFVLSPAFEDSSPRPLQVSAKDFGYEIDEQELAEELIAPLPGGISASNPPEVAPDDFESIYGWFIA